MGLLFRSEVAEGFSIPVLLSLNSPPCCVPFNPPFLGWNHCLSPSHPSSGLRVSHVLSMMGYEVGPPHHLLLYLSFSFTTRKGNGESFVCIAWLNSLCLFMSSFQEPHRRRRLQYPRSIHICVLVSPHPPCVSLLSLLLWAVQTYVGPNLQNLYGNFPSITICFPRTVNPLVMADLPKW